MNDKPCRQLAPGLPPLSENLRVFIWHSQTCSYGEMGITPSALQSSENAAVLLPESFRGGCSFGAGAAPDLSRLAFYANRMKARGMNRKRQVRLLDS